MIRSVRLLAHSQNIHFITWKCFPPAKNNFRFCFHTSFISVLFFLSSLISEPSCKRVLTHQWRRQKMYFCWPVGDTAGWAVFSQENITTVLVCWVLNLLSFPDREPRIGHRQLKSGKVCACACMCVWHWRIPTFPKLHSFNQNGSCSSKVGQKKMEATLVTTESQFFWATRCKKKKN